MRRYMMASGNLYDRAGAIGFGPQAWPPPPNEELRIPIKSVTLILNIFNVEHPFGVHLEVDRDTCTISVTEEAPPEWNNAEYILDRAAELPRDGWFPETSRELGNWAFRHDIKTVT
jgi:hypothetical protein